MRLLIWIVLLAFVAVALVMILRPNGSGVTRIEDLRGDDEEDRDDA